MARTAHRSNSPDLEAHMPGSKDSTFFVGTYTNNEILAHIPKGEHGEGIYSWKLDGETGKLTGPVTVSPIHPNPAFIMKHPTKDVLYASTECIHKEKCGEIITLGVGEDGVTLKELARVSAGGRSTCYLTLHKGLELMAAVNYWDAIVSLLPVCGSTGVVGEAIDTHMQPGAQYVFDKNPDRVEHWTYRQRWNHTHCFVTEPYKQEYHFVPDLGVDKMWWYSVDATNGKLRLRGGVQLEAQQGPRHAVFHPRCKTMYVVNELKSTVATFHYQPKDEAPEDLLEEDATDENAVLHRVQTLRTLPEDFESNDHHKSHASEIRLHPSGKWLFIANRGHDSIAVYAVDESKQGHLSLAHITPSGGVFPRNFNFDATGSFVVVGNQNSNNLTCFKFDTDMGTMKVVDTVHQPSPNFLFGVASDSMGALAAARHRREAVKLFSVGWHYALLVTVVLFWGYAAVYIGNRRDL